MDKDIGVFFLTCISYLMILASALNDGFSGPYLGIPFIIYGLGRMYSGFKKPNLYFFFGLIIFSIFITMRVGDRSRFSFVYPIVGEEIIVLKDTTISSSAFRPYSINFHDCEKRDAKRYKQSPCREFILKKGSKFKITRSIKMGNPDIMGVSFDLELDLDNVGLAQEIINYTKFNEQNLDFRVGYYRFLDTVGARKHKNVLKNGKLYISDWQLLRYDKHFDYNYKEIEKFPRPLEILTAPLIIILYFPILGLFLLLIFFVYIHEGKDERTKKEGLRD